MEKRIKDPEILRIARKYIRREDWDDHSFVLYSESLQPIDHDTQQVRWLRVDLAKHQVVRVGEEFFNREHRFWRNLFSDILRMTVQDIPSINPNLWYNYRWKDILSPFERNLDFFYLRLKNIQADQKRLDGTWEGNRLRKRHKHTTDEEINEQCLRLCRTLQILKDTCTARVGEEVSAKKDIELSLQSSRREERRRHHEINYQIFFNNLGRRAHNFCTRHPVGLFFFVGIPFALSCYYAYTLAVDKTNPLPALTRRISAFLPHAQSHSHLKYTVTLPISRRPFAPAPLP